MPRCRFEVAGQERAADLPWQPISAAALQQRVAEAQGNTPPALGLRKVGEVWIVSIPSFTWTGEGIATMQGFIDELGRQAATLHAARHVVIDVRGNDGGSSTWGEAAASALWGRARVQAVADTFGRTVEWRVSERNAAALRSDAAMFRAAGQVEPAESVGALAARMAALGGAGTKLLPVAEPAGPMPAPFASPFRHPVYVLTDASCASACLDFMDLPHRLPGVAQAGQATSADTPCLGLAFAPLPSGQATLACAMKVCRNPARRCNE